MKVNVPIGNLDIELFQELQVDGISFDWNLKTECGKTIKLVFVKDEEEDE